MPPRFAPARWLAHAHLQTLYAALLARAPRIAWRRERWETPDGDFVDVDFVDGRADAPWLHLFHGLEGSSQSPYARALIGQAMARGWRGSVFHFRGCSGEPNRLARAYHSGDSDEVAWVIERLHARVAGAPLYVTGISLGGNALGKYLGERGEAARAFIERAAIVSAPLDLAAAADSLERGMNRIYVRNFLSTLIPSSMEKLARYPGIFDAARARRATTLREFDDAVTAPLHGFRDADDYYARSSAKPFLARIAVPTLVINARDDPFLPGNALPTEREVSAAVKLEFPPGGGHVGFVSGPFPGRIDWLPRRVFHFFEHHE